MFFEGNWVLDGVLILVIATALAVFAAHLQRTYDRVKAIKNQLGRLSLTFLKIENDLDLILKILAIHAEEKPELKADIEQLIQNRREVFRRTILNADQVPQIMRGLELPDIDEDPNFWRDRLEKFGYGPRDGKS